MDWAHHKPLSTPLFMLLQMPISGNSLDNRIKMLFGGSQGARRQKGSWLSSTLKWPTSNCMGALSEWWGDWLVSTPAVRWGPMNASGKVTEPCQHLSVRCSVVAWRAEHLKSSRMEELSILGLVWPHIQHRPGHFCVPAQSPKTGSSAKTPSFERHPI